MTIDLTDTTTGAINDALRQARLRLGGVASGMVLTLVIVTNEGEQYDAVRAASAAGRQHPCRILVLALGVEDRAQYLQRPRMMVMGAQHLQAPSLRGAELPARKVLPRELEQRARIGR